MITEDHLKHWMHEIEWQLNGINTEINKKGYKKLTGTILNKDYLSFEYLREKEGKIRALLKTIQWDVDHDG